MGNDPHNLCDDRLLSNCRILRHTRTQCGCNRIGVTIGAYQGNSSLEKYSRAKYQYENLVQLKDKDEEIDESCANG